MSTYQSLKTVNLPAGANLSGKGGSLVKIDSNGRVVQATAAGDAVIGFLAQDPGTTATDGSDMVNVTLIGGGGIGRVKASAAITAGHLLVAATDGKAAGVANLGALAADTYAFGQALEAASAANEIIEFLAQPFACPHSA